MNKTSLAWIALVALAFVSGLAIGNRSGKDGPPDSNDPGLVPTAPPRLGVADPDALSGAQTDAQDAGEVPDLGVSTDEKEELIQIPLRFVGRFNVGAFKTGFLKGAELKLSQDVVDFLNLNDAEKVEVESLLRKLASDLRDYETEHVERLPDDESGRTILEVKVSEEFGSRMKESQTTGIANILGEQRGAAFNSLTQEYLGLIVGSPNQVKRLTFIPQENGDFKIRVEIKSPTEGGSTYHVSSKGEEMPHAIKHMASLR